MFRHSRRLCVQKWQLAKKKIEDVYGISTYEGVEKFLDTPDNTNVGIEDLEFLTKIVCRRMPKCEFHAHLSGCISKDLLLTLEIRRGCGVTLDRQAKVFELKRKPRDMQDAFKIFPLIQDLVARPEDVTEVTVEVIREFSRENVVYLELRSTPRKTDHMSTDDYVKALIEGVIRARDFCPEICVRILLSIDRRQTVEQAEETINLALKYMYDGEKIASNAIIIGVEISGDPRYDARKFLPLLHKAKKRLPVISFHLGETMEHLDEVQHCLNLGPTRIGHATYIHKIPDIKVRNMCLEHIRDHKIPIEICLGSNMMCGTVKSVNNSHFMYYYAEKHPILICTDNRSLMRCSLTDEYSRIASALSLDPEDVFQLALSATNYMDKFLNPEEKNRILREFHKFAAFVGAEMDWTPACCSCKLLK